MKLIDKERYRRKNTNKYNYRDSFNMKKDKIKLKSKIELNRIKN